MALGFLAVSKLFSRSVAVRAFTNQLGVITEIYC